MDQNHVGLSLCPLRYICPYHATPPSAPSVAAVCKKNCWGRARESRWVRGMGGVLVCRVRLNDVPTLAGHTEVVDGLACTATTTPAWKLCSCDNPEIKWPDDSPRVLTRGIRQTLERFTLAHCTRTRATTYGGTCLRSRRGAARSGTCTSGLGTCGRTCINRALGRALLEYLLEYLAKHLLAEMHGRSWESVVLRRVCQASGTGWCSWPVRGAAALCSWQSTRTAP